MRYLKMLGLATIATGALMAIGGADSVSATQLTAPAGVVATSGTTIEAVAEGHVVLDPPIGKIECASTIEGVTANSGGSVETVAVLLTTLSFSGCTHGAGVNALGAGTFEIHSIAGTHNGTLTSTGASWTVEFSGFHCIFRTENTDLGVLTGSSTTGGRATLDLSAIIPRSGGRSGAFCGMSAAMTGSYAIVNSPSFLDVD